MMNLQRSAPAARMRVRPFLRLCLLLGLASLAGCGGDGLTVPSDQATIVLEDSSFSFTALGQNHLFAVRGLDGDDLSSLIWSTSNPAVVKVNGDGLATAAGAGSAVLTVSSGAASARATVTVSQTPAHLVAVLGDRQSGPPSTVLPSPLTVQVTDALNRPIAGVLVNFAAGGEGGSVGFDTATTDYAGLASTPFTLGAVEGAYTASATVPGTSLSASFTLQTGGPFDIELVFLSSATPSQTQAFTTAEGRWEAAIQADLPDDYAILPANSCGESPALDRPIDDLLIFVTIADIDGPGGVLAQAGPCFAHGQVFLPAIGLMVFDAADLDAMEGLGLLSSVVLHEMGHVLGYGTLWIDLGLLADPASQGGIDPHFTGAQAIAAFDSAGGAGYLNAKVPVEDQGGPGTADSHWRDLVFGNEVMTGFLSQGFNPLSTTSIASLADLGYTVDLSVADTFSITPSARPSPSSGVRLRLGNDIFARPMGVIKPGGKIAPPYRP